MLKITVEMEYDDSDDDWKPPTYFIDADIRRELNCCSLLYDVRSITIKEDNQNGSTDDI